MIQKVLSKTTPAFLHLFLDDVKRFLFNLNHITKYGESFTLKDNWKQTYINDKLI